MDLIDEVDLELRRKGGYLGIVRRKDLKPEISAAVFTWSRGAERNMGMKPRHKGRSYWGGVQAPSQFSPLLPAPFPCLF